MPNVKYEFPKGIMTYGAGEDAVTVEIRDAVITFNKKSSCDCNIYEHCQECAPEFFKKQQALNPKQSLRLTGRDSVHMSCYGYRTMDNFMKCLACCKKHYPDAHIFYLKRVSDMIKILTDIYVECGNLWVLSITALRQIGHVG